MNIAYGLYVSTTYGRVSQIRISCFAVGRKAWVPLELVAPVAAAAPGRGRMDLSHYELDKHFKKSNIKIYTRKKNGAARAANDIGGPPSMVAPKAAATPTPSPGLRLVRDDGTGVGMGTPAASRSISDSTPRTKSITRMPPPTPRDATTGTKTGRTLRHASWKGDVATLMKCINEGADVDEPNRQGRTALAYACEGGHLNIVCTLLEKGVSVNKDCEDGHTALHYAAREGQVSIALALLGTPQHGLSSNKMALITSDCF